jgi:alpha-beta hydrolase superfamily lysophospholipase
LHDRDVHRLRRLRAALAALPGAGTPRAHVVCIHGIQSHGGWYEYSCTRLAQAGFTVSFLDRRGSGLNDATRRHAGFRRLLDDIAEFIHPLRTGSPGLPVFLVGISWVENWRWRLQQATPRPDRWGGVALPRHRGPCEAAVPGAVQDPLVAGRGGPRRFPIPLNDPELFTGNPARQQFIRDDPLSLREATARFLIESVRLGGYLRLVRRSIRLPVLLMLAGRDRIVHNDRVRAYVESLPPVTARSLSIPTAPHP